MYKYTTSLSFLILSSFYLCSHKFIHIIILIYLFTYSYLFFLSKVGSMKTRVHMYLLITLSSLTSAIPVWHIAAAAQ